MSERVAPVVQAGRLDRLAQLPLLAPLQARDYRLVWFGSMAVGAAGIGLFVLTVLG